MKHNTKRDIRFENKKNKIDATTKMAKLCAFDIACKNKKPPPDPIEPKPKRICTDIVNIENNKAQEKVVKKGQEKGAVEENEEYLNFKKRLNEKVNLPKFRLRESGESALLTVDIQNRTPIFLSDVQHLILQSVVDQLSTYQPYRWCQLDKAQNIRQTNVLVIDNLSLLHYERKKKEFKNLNALYERKLEMLTSTEREDCVQEMATVPITHETLMKLVKKHGNIRKMLQENNDIYDLIKHVFVYEGPNSTSENLHPSDRFSRKKLLLSGWQMVEENYPLPIKGLIERKFKDYVKTKDIYKHVTNRSPMFGVDCEMCRTVEGSELTRVSMVDENLDLVYDELVKPDNPILDYITRMSGITEEMLRPVTKKLAEVQNDLRRILPADAILVGQSLNSDLHALKMMHPYIIDTSVIYNLSGTRSRKSKLSYLSKEFLGETIQNSKHGHDPREDSSASLKLVQLKLSKDIFFGDAVMSPLKMFASHSEVTETNYAVSMLKQATQTGKKALVCAQDEQAQKYSFYTYRNQEEDEKITINSVNSNQEIFNALLRKPDGFHLSIGHMKLTKNDYEQDVTKMVDGWVKDLHQLSPHRSLNVVIFGGDQEVGGNGCCFINLKNQFV